VDNGGETKPSCIRVVSWVVYYGHTRLLQYIAERVLSNNESISAIFGTKMEEQARYLIQFFKFRVWFFIQYFNEDIHKLWMS
jgi:hypothetical protein